MKEEQGRLVWELLAAEDKPSRDVYSVFSGAVTFSILRYMIIFRLFTMKMVSRLGSSFRLVSLDNTMRK